MLTVPLISDADKQRVWDAYRAQKPVRTPMMLVTNPRVYLLNPAWNTAGHTFEQAAEDPQIQVKVSLMHQLYLHRELHQWCDMPTELPDRWLVGIRHYNVSEAASMGAKVYFEPDQVPDTRPILNDDNKESIFSVDITNPLELPYLKERYAFWQQMKRVCDGMSFEGRPVELATYVPVGTDWPLTVACNLRGTDFLEDLLVDPDYAQRLLRFITRAAIFRRQAYEKLFGSNACRVTGIADDSCQMLSVDMYRTLILPWHRMLYDDMTGNADRLMHMCGNVAHLLPTLRRELNITKFDTGFPIDHGKLRQDLGEDVEIQGGTEIALLLNGTPERNYVRTREILQSGVMAGGRFILREGNNLPPNCPPANLEAMYAACLEHGWYDQ